MKLAKTIANKTIALYFCTAELLDEFIKSVAPW